MDKYEKQIIRSLRELRNTIKPDPALEAQSREKIFAYFKENFSKGTVPVWGLSLLLRPVIVSLLVLIFVFAGGYGALYVARNTIPGDFLYQVKRVSEKTRMALTQDQSKKNVLRAEILTSRLEEASLLAEKVAKGDKDASSKLSSLTKDFKEELSRLKKEVIAQKPGDTEVYIQPGDQIFPEEELLVLEEPEIKPDLPVQDTREIFTLNQTKDLRKILGETKALLAEKNLVVALEKINDAEKIGLESEEESSLLEEAKPTIEQQVPTSTPPVLEEPKSPKPIEGSTGQILKPSPEPQPEPETKDFGTGLIREAEVSGGMLRED